MCAIRTFWLQQIKVPVKAQRPFKQFQAPIADHKAVAVHGVSASPKMACHSRENKIPRLPASKYFTVSHLKVLSIEVRDTKVDED